MHRFIVVSAIVRHLFSVKQNVRSYIKISHTHTHTCVILWEGNVWSVTPSIDLSLNWKHNDWLYVIFQRLDWRSKRLYPDIFLILTLVVAVKFV